MPWNVPVIVKLTDTSTPADTKELRLYRGNVLLSKGAPNAAGEFTYTDVVRDTDPGFPVVVYESEAADGASPPNVSARTSLTVPVAMLTDTIPPPPPGMRFGAIVYVP